MKSLLSYYALVFVITGCVGHHHSVMQKHWHSCDGETFYTPIEYDDELKSCTELLKADILQELKRNG